MYANRSMIIIMCCLMRCIVGMCTNKSLCAHVDYMS